MALQSTCSAMSMPLLRLRYLALLLIVPLAACNLGIGKQAATPPPPKPAAVQPPAPEPQLSVPQTAVTLPSPQPVNPDAIPAAPPAQVPVVEKIDTPAPTVRSSTRHAATTPPKTEPETEVENPQAPAVQEQAPIQPILSGEEQKRLQDSIDARKKQIEERLNRAKRHPSSHDQPLIDRINSFLAQCTQAEQRGEYAQADALSERAEILARELPGE